ncbi:MAG: Superfamily II helicase [uncultured Acidilobus sp. CIS]|jgi:Superfamily II helicase|nr:MAG: Superfamily II helicase [uncultured Acidilobus sp. CIS]
MNALGYDDLYPPQRAALEAGVVDGNSLVVASPTASGKTFIALMAIVSALKRSHSAKAFYTAPLRSIAGEKFREFKRVLEPFGYRVGLSIGDYELPARLDSYDVVVTTYEKLDSMIRNSPEMLPRVGALVIDEIHYVDDDKRGPIVETLLSKVLYKAPGAQLVALSATAPNADELASWIKAKLVISDWRPVPLHEGVYKDGTIHFSDGRKKRVEDVTANSTLNLVVDSSRDGGQALVFVQSRKKAVQLAKSALRLLKGKIDYRAEVADEVSEAILSTEGPMALRDELAELIRGGVAYHHAGLSNEQRTLIEDGFRRGGIAAIFATPTLAAGVNLPARRVVVAEYLRYEEGGWKPLKVFEYKQLAGRAGRPGLDPYGEAVIVAMRGDTVEDLEEYYIEGRLERLQSRLYGLRGVRHSALGAIASGIATDEDSLLELHRRTLYYVQRGEERVKDLVRKAVDDLVNWGLVERTPTGVRATELGARISRTYLDPTTVPIFRKLTSKVRKFTTSTLLYIISAMPDMTPIPTTSSEAERIMDILIDIAPELVEVVDWTDLEAVASVKTALVLLEWIEESSDDDITKKYSVGPGDVASAVDTAKWISSSLAEVAPALGVSQEVSSQLKLLSARIEHGVKAELLPLVAIPGVGRVRARRLYNAGFTSLEKLATARIDDLLRVPGIGYATAASILEFFGRKDEAQRLRKENKREGPGITRFLG